jgi:thiol:disulfide interchange protein DsbD
VAVKLGYKNVYRDPRGYPEWQRQGLPVESAPAGLTEKSPTNQTSRPMFGWSIIWTLLGIFAGGMALNLTPCVYPLIPVTVSYFGGQAAKQGPEKRGRLIPHGLCYIIGLATMNSSLGVVAALTGGLMGAILQSPIVLTIVATILVFFATSMFGFWELRLPSRLTQVSAKSYTGYFGSLFMGLTLGVVAAPCIGPFVLGLLTWVASIGNPWFGFLIFFILSLGLGLPLFLVAIFSGQLEKLPRSGDWMIWVRSLLGWVLVGMAAYFIKPLLPESWGIFLLSFISLSAGFHLGWFDKNRANFRAFDMIKTGTGLTCLVIATFLFVSWAITGPGVVWRPYSDQILAEAQKAKKPIVIDFYASWCAPCRELEERTFRNPSVVKQAESDFIMIKVDLTRSGNPDHEHLLQKYGVKGVPTVVFLDEDGEERHELRLVDYLPPDQFLSQMMVLKLKNP